MRRVKGEGRRPPKEDIDSGNVSCRISCEFTLYAFMHPSAVVLPFRLLKRMTMFMIQKTERILPCALHLYIIGGIMGFAKGLALDHRRSGTISHEMEGINNQSLYYCAGH